MENEYEEEVVTVEYEEIPEESEYANESMENDDDVENTEEDQERIEEEPEESETTEVRETISVTFDDIPLNTQLNNLGVVGVSCLIVLFLLGTIVVMRGD